VANIDSSGLPSIRLTVVTSAPSSRPPRVTENGKMVVDFSARNLGDAESVVLAVDRSRSMHGRALRDAVAAALRFLALKRPNDRVAVVSFASQTLTVSHFSTSTGDGSAALRSLTDDPRYGTTLYDAVVQASHTLKAQGPAGRVIVLVTDGQETTSKASLAQAVHAARAAHVLVYPVAIESSAFEPAPLRELARKTGGSYYGASSSAALARIYARISRELRRTWSLEYMTSARPGDRVRLRVAVPGLGSVVSSARVAGTERASHSSAWPGAILVFALALAAVVLGLLAMPLLGVVRSHVPWRGNDAEL
jgi:VWFA-related protein